MVFRKDEWEISDYPVRIAKLEEDSPYRSSRFKEHDYRASIINWAVMGTGSSPREATESLRATFEELRQTGEQNGTAPLRPGSHAKLEFANQDKISAYGELSEDVTHRVLGLEWAWISEIKPLGLPHRTDKRSVLCESVRSTASMCRTLNLQRSGPFSNE